MKIRTDTRTGIKFIDYRIGGKRKRVSLGTKNNQIALVKAAKFADNKTIRDTGETPLQAFLDKYRAYLSATKSKQTGEIFEMAWRKLEKYNAPKQITDITPALLDDLQITLKNNGAGNAGINRTTRALRTAMKQAEYWRIVAPQDWQGVARFRENKSRVDYHTPQEIRQILAICPSEGWRLVVLLGARAGLRRGEMAQLKWQDVDFENRQLYIEPNKTENGRYVPMVADLYTALETAQKHAKSEYVIMVGSADSRGSKDFITTYYSHFTRTLPFKCYLHKLRHTFASHLVQNGADLYHVSKLMGHGSIKMTEIYAHLAPRAMADVIKLLPKI